MMNAVRNHSSEMSDELEVRRFTLLLFTTVEVKKKTTTTLYNTYS